MHTYEDQASAKNKNSYYYEFITIWTLCQKIHSENIIGVPIVLNQKCISANWLKALLSQKKLTKQNMPRQFYFQIIFNSTSAKRSNYLTIAATISNAAASASSTLATSLAPACAISGRPPPPPPHSLATALTILPA